MTEYIKNMRRHIGHQTLIVVGVGVFIHKNGKLLLQKRRDNGCWADHGGCVEIGVTHRNKITLKNRNKLTLKVV